MDTLFPTQPQGHPFICIYVTLTHTHMHTRVHAPLENRMTARPFPLEPQLVSYLTLSSETLSNPPQNSTAQFCFVGEGLEPAHPHFPHKPLIPHFHQ